MAALARKRPQPANTIETYEGLMAGADDRSRRGAFDHAAFLAARAAQQPRRQNPRGDRFRAHLRAADLHRLARNYAAAEAHIRNASGVASTPSDDASVASVMAAILRDKGQLKQGLRIMQQYLGDIGPNDPYAFGLAATSLGQLQLLSGERSAAYATLTRANQSLEDSDDSAAQQAALKWLVMAERPHRRLKPGWQSLRLALRRRTFWRAAETVVLLVGGRTLYKLLNPRRSQSGR